MDMPAAIQELNRIAPELRVRILYEALPWDRRSAFADKIMDPAVKPIRPDMAVCGPAFTVADPFMSFDMLADARKRGHVVVVQSSGCEGAFVGDFMRELATRDGVLGIVTDGYVTHTASLIGHDFPIFACGSRIPDAGYEMEGSLQVPITCGGVVVNPDDIIVGNLDGVMVLSLAEAGELAEKSQWFTRVVGTLMKKYMDQGVRYTDAPGVREYWVHKTSGSKNEDEFYKEWCEKYGD